MKILKEKLIGQIGKHVFTGRVVVYHSGPSSVRRVELHSQIDPLRAQQLDSGLTVDDLETLKQALMKFELETYNQ